MANLIGQTIKGYELLERIGAGGFGAVYRSYQSTLGREVAVKVILPGFANRPEFIRRFEMEAQLVARLEHLYIVPLYDYWRDPDGAYLVMRWMRGGSLQQALQEGPFDLEPAALLVNQVASALAAAHSQGVIHCDLKPSNVLFDEEGNAYLADFSIARVVRSRESGRAQRAEAEGLHEGISPEQARGEGATPLTDIYGLGVLLYQTLTDEHPFPGIPPVQRLYKQLNDPLPAIEEIDEGVRGEINAVIQKATAKNPKHRFQDAVEMATAFRIAAQLDVDPSVPAEALTGREEDVLERIVDGLTNREIAEDLFVEVSTVKWYITQIYRKLGVRSRKQAVALVREARLLAWDEDGEAAEPAAGVSLPEPVNPYKGLRAFDISDARDFFGREEIVAELLDRLALAPDSSRPLPGRSSPGAGRFLAIVGPSGSGKSSLVKAGLIPALRQGEVSGADRWFTVQLVPGRRPLDQLEIGLTRVAAGQSANMRQHLERDAHGLLRVAELILPQNESELLVVIDQFEEAFTLVEDEAARAHFLALLATAAGDPHSRVRVVLTLRADYYDRPLHYPGFGDLLRNQMETVLPLSAGELERAIMRPAEQVGVSFEPGLVETIIDDIAYQPGALPLLQYALTELFEARDERTLTHAAYEAIGGTAGALGGRAEEVYQEQESEGREMIRQLFLRLVALDGDVATSAETRQKVPRSELAAVVANDELMDEIVDTYAAYRLLTLDHDPDSRRPTVEIAHEALLREWKRLDGWLDESRADLRLRRQLARAAEEWRQGEEDESYLLRGARLEQFGTWSTVTELALSPGERAYLEASMALREERAAAEATRRAREVKLEERARRVLQALVAVFLLAAVISGWFAWDADRQRGQAERNYARAESQRLAAEANIVLEREGSAEVAALLALRGLNADYTLQADVALQRAAAAPMASALIEAPGFSYFPLFSPDSRYVRFMSDSPDGNMIAELWDVAQPTATNGMERLWQVRGYFMPGRPFSVRDFTADYSALVALTLPDDKLVLLDTQTGEEVMTFPGQAARILDFQLSEDGNVLVAGDTNGSVHVWNTASGDAVRRFSMGPGQYAPTPDRVLIVAVSPDGRRVVGRAGGVSRIWDIESGEEVYGFEHLHDGRNQPQFVDDGRLLMTSSEPELSLWDLTTGEEVEHGIPDSDSGLLSPDGTIYAQGWVGDGSQDVILWEVATGRSLHRLTGHSDSAEPLAFINGGRQLITWSQAGSVRIWDVATGKQLRLLAGHADALLGADISRDGRFLVTAGQDATVRIWDLQAPLGASNQIAGARKGLHFSPDGRVALTADEETNAAILVDTNSFEALHQLDFDLPDIGYSSSRSPFSSDGALVLGVKEFATILVYEVASGEPVGEYANPDGEDGVYPWATFVPGERRIFAGGNRGAYLLDADNGNVLRVFEVPDTDIFASFSGYVAVSPDGQYGALHTWTPKSLSVVHVWELETGDLVFRSTPLPDDVIVAFDFAEDGHTFAWGGTRNVAYVVDLRTGEEVARLRHLDSVHGIDFSADDGLMLTSTGGSGVILWDLESGGVVRRFYAGNGQAGYVRLVEDERVALYSTLEDGVLHRQPVSVERLIELACAKVNGDFTDAQRQLHGLDDAPTCPQFAGS